LVDETRARQFERQGCINANLSARECEDVCQLGPTEHDFLHQIVSQLKLSARGYHRLLKVARTITDMRRADKTALTDLQQALSFKQTLQAS
jgi:magnesium chelatase family protein